MRLCYTCTVFLYCTDLKQNMYICSMSIIIIIIICSPVNCHTSAQKYTVAWSVGGRPARQLLWLPVDINCCSSTKSDLSLSAIQSAEWRLNGPLKEYNLHQYLRTWHVRTHNAYGVLRISTNNSRPVIRPCMFGNHLPLSNRQGMLCTRDVPAYIFECLGTNHEALFLDF